MGRAWKGLGGRQGRKKAELTLAEVRRIGEAHDAGVTYKAIAERFRIGRDSVKTLLVKAQRERRNKLWT